MEVGQRHSRSFLAITQSTKVVDMVVEAGYLVDPPSQALGPSEEDILQPARDGVPGDLLRSPSHLV